MAEKSKEPEQAPRKPDTPVPESEVVSMGDMQLSSDADTATSQIMDAMVGQEGDEPRRSETTKIMMGGQEFEVNSDMAAAFQAQQEDFQRQHEELRGLMPKRPVREPGPEPTKVEGPNWGEMIFDDPNRFAKEFGDHVRQETITEMRGQYTADQGMRDFWDGFYRENEDLREFDWVVKASLNRHNSELIDLPVSQATTKLAEFSRGDILGLVGKFKSETKGKVARTTVESGRSMQESASETGSDKQVEESTVTSISSIIRDRKRERREKAAS